MKRTAMKPSTIPLKSAGFSRVDRIESREVAKLRKVPDTGPRLRMRKCAQKTCRKLFAPRSITHKCCGAECAIQYAVDERVRFLKAERRVGLERLKSRTTLLREAQAVFNSFIRLRDADEPCASCGRAGNCAWDAGHYRSVGAMPALRFTELNCHKQCVQCNQHKAGNVVEYRIRLEQKIGRAALEWLEQDHPAAKWTIDEIKAIKLNYTAKIKELKREAATT